MDTGHLMPTTNASTVNILVPVGALGLGVKESDVFARLGEAFLFHTGNAGSV